MRGRWKTKTSSLILKKSVLICFFGTSPLLEAHWCFQTTFSPLLERLRAAEKQDSAMSRIIITKSLARLTWFTVAFLLPFKLTSGVRWLILPWLPQLQVVSVGESWVFAELPVGSIGRPHLSASLVQVFPEGSKGGRQSLIEHPRRFSWNITSTNKIELLAHLSAN